MENRWEAIDELINQLVATHRIKAEHRAAISESVRKRESSMSTGIGSGIGLPHASSDLINKVVGAIGRSRKGIEFDAPDGKLVSRLRSKATARQARLLLRASRFAPSFPLRSEASAAAQKLPPPLRSYGGRDGGGMADGGTGQGTQPGAGTRPTIRARTQFGGPLAPAVGIGFGALYPDPSGWVLPDGHCGKYFSVSSSRLSGNRNSHDVCRRKGSIRCERLLERAG